MAAVFPTTVPTTAQLRTLVNNCSTSLTSDITSAVTTIPADDTSRFPSAGDITIGEEIITYTGTTPTSFTGCTRGAYSSTAVAHVGTDIIHQYYIAYHHNQLRDELIAVAQNISDRFGLGSTDVKIASGRVLIVATTARAIVSATPYFQLEGTDGTLANASIIRNSANNAPPILNFGKSRGASNGSVTIVQADDELGRIFFVGTDGVNANSYGARISAFVDGTPGANDMPGRLVFYTTADGASSSTERMRITNAGLFGINTTSPSSSAGGVDIASGGLSLVIGAESGVITRTDATSKLGRIAGYHYTNAEEPVGIILYQASTSANSLSFGGGSASFNAATTIGFYTAANSTTTTGTQRMVIDSGGLFGINTTSPSSTNGGLDIASGGLSLILGANNNAMTTRTDATLKAARVGLYHYTNAEEPAAILSLSSSSTDNEIDIGGGTNTMNASTIISFYTAATNTTVTGTERMRIGSTGNVGIAPTAKLYLDGVTLAGDTYIQEDSSNEILFFVGGSNAFLATTTTVRISASHDLVVTSGTKLYLDSGGDSYLIESSANVLDVFAGATNILRMTATEVFSTDYTDYSAVSTVTGWAATPTKLIYYKKIGKLTFVWFNITGTSNATTVSFTLATAASNTVDVVGSASITDNGAALTTPGRIQLVKNTSTVNVFKDMASAAFTNTGTKTVQGHFVYQTT